MKRLAALGLTIWLTLAGAARSEVLETQASGFAVRETRVIAAPIGKTWQGPVKPAAWWSPDHTFLHDAGNLSLEARPGGEWRETLSGGGGLTHLVVIYLALLSILRLEGALGTLQVLGVADHPTFSLEDQGAATLTTATYEVGGHENGGFDSMAAAVGHVLDAQLGRLKTYVETGATPWTSKSFPILV